MIVAACPSCRENVTVPVDARPSSIVRCPLCNAECRLEEFLAQLPPSLIVVEDAQYGPTSAALPASDDHDTSGMPQLDIDIDIGGPREPDEQLPAFDFTPARLGDDSARPREHARRPARPPTSTIWEIAKIVGGALLAVPAAQFILWWCVPTDWKRDLLGIGPAMSRLVPWVVPAKFHADVHAERIGSTSPALDAESQFAQWPRAATPPRTWESPLPDLNAPGAAEADGAAEEPAPTIVDLTDPAPADADTADADATDVDAAETDAATSSVVVLPRYSVADLRAALEQALQASVAWDTSPDQTAPQQASLSEEFYRAFAHLGEIMAFMAPGDAQARELAAAVRDLLASFARQPKKLALIGNRATEWLDQPERPNQGIFLFGTVGQIGPQGALFVTELEVASLKKRSVSVVSRLDPAAFYAPGDHILMLGALIPEPAQNLPGYAGHASHVVLGSFPMRLR